MRGLIASGSPFERQIGFARAVRVGNIVEVSGFINPDCLAEIELSAVIENE